MFQKTSNNLNKNKQKYVYIYCLQQFNNTTNDIKNKNVHNIKNKNKNKSNVFRLQTRYFH